MLRSSTWVCLIWGVGIVYHLNYKMDQANSDVLKPPGVPIDLFQYEQFMMVTEANPTTEIVVWVPN